MKGVKVCSDLERFICYYSYNEENPNSICDPAQHKS